MSVVREIMTAVANELRSDANLRAEFRDLLGVTAEGDSKEILFERVNEFAARLDCSRRHVFDLIDSGLPTIGKGKSRRVDVKRGVEWMRTRSEVVDDDVEKKARASARRTVTRIGRGPR